MDASTFINGSDANALNIGIDSIGGAVGSIFSAVGGNKYATSYRFKDADVVILETARDNRALIAAVGTVLLVILVAFVIIS